MIKKSGIILLLLLNIQMGYSQFVDDFTDADFTLNPVWSGDDVLFTAVTNELNSQSPTAGNYYLSTPSTLALSAQWDFYFNMQFGTSGVNYTDVYLTSDVADITNPNDGYFVRIGGTPDEVSFYKVVGGTETILIDGPDGVINSTSNNPFDVRVTRDAGNNWTLFYDDGAASSLISIGTIMDNSTTTSAFFGLAITQSGAASAVNGHFFDNFIIGPIGGGSVDVTAPLIDSLVALNANNLDVYFDEPVGLASAQTLTNYSVDLTIGNPSAAVRDVIDSSIVHLTFATAFTNGQNYNLTTTNVTDTLANAITSIVEPFTYLVLITPTVGDVIINEIFADPTPQVGLPTEEFVELYNNTGSLFVLNNWQFVNSTTVKTLPNFFLQANSHVILCDINDTLLFQPFGDVIGISSFTAMVNGGDSLTLMDDNSNILDIVNYDISWYQDLIKDDGGWTLERINPNHPCSNSLNWIASIDVIGGTPGIQNSVFDNTPDTQAPQIDSVNVVSLTQLEVFFTETMDSTSLANAAYTISGSSLISGITIQPNLSEVILDLTPAIDSLVFYTLTITGGTDCSGNGLNPDSIIFSKGLVDTIPPQIDSLIVIDANNLDVYFSETVGLTTSQILVNYSADIGLGNPSAAVRDVVDSSIVHITFATAFTNGQNYNLTTSNVEDNGSNVILNSIDPFIYILIIAPNVGDVVINEIFADPSPQVGLPLEEFVELHNKSNNTFVLNNWKFINSAIVKTIPNTILAPNSYIILCDVNDTADYSSYGNVIGIPSFSALTNGGDSLTLMDDNNTILDVVKYDDSWYQDAVKDAGGWTLERINPSQPCGDVLNWIASLNLDGGTPGIENSVFDTMPDIQSPEIVSAIPSGANQISILFNETMDSTSLANAVFTLSNGLGVVSFTMAIDFKGGVITTVAGIEMSIYYTLTIVGANDCSGNATSTNTATFILPEQGGPGDIVINEVLFNPFTGSDDFVEVYNKSNKIINLQGWSLANLDNDSIDNYKELTDQLKLILPGEFVLLTKNTQGVENDYLNAVASSFLQMGTLPTYSNDEGDVYLINNLNVVVDEFHYKDDMHFALLNSEDGVSLERIDYERPSSDETNWHSAAEDEGFATPGFENSQYMKADNDGGEIVISPETFSPDNDGVDDVVNISYNFSSEGSVANVIIYDAKGRLIKNLVQNELLGTSGTFSWDGINESNEKGRIGIYIIFAEIFDVDGNVKSYKKAVVLAGRFN